MFEIVNPLESRRWDDLVLEAGNHSIFNSRVWARVLVETYHFLPKYLVRVESGSLQFLLPIMAIQSPLTGKRGSALPFTDYIEPILKNGFSTENILPQVLQMGERFQWKTLEFRGGREILGHPVPSLHYYFHKLDLDREDSVYAKFRANVRRNIKKARRKGVKISVNDSSESLQEYYRLHCLTRKKHGLPPQPLHFFKNIYTAVISAGHGKIVTAKYSGRTIAAALYFQFGDQAVFKFAASDMNYQHLRGNNLVMWEAIRYFIRCGVRSLHLGKTELQNQGLRRYKKSWGAEEEIAAYYKFHFGKQRFIHEVTRERGWYNHFFRGLPLPLLKISGDLLYKHFG